MLHHARHTASVRHSNLPLLTITVTTTTATTHCCCADHCSCWDASLSFSLSLSHPQGTGRQGRPSPSSPWPHPPKRSRSRTRRPSCPSLAATGRPPTEETDSISSHSVGFDFWLAKRKASTCEGMESYGFCWGFDIRDNYLGRGRLRFTHAGADNNLQQNSFEARAYASTKSLYLLPWSSTRLPRVSHTRTGKAFTPRQNTDASGSLSRGSKELKTTLFSHHTIPCLPEVSPEEGGPQSPSPTRRQTRARLRSP